MAIKPVYEYLEVFHISILHKNLWLCNTVQVNEYNNHKYPYSPNDYYEFNKFM